MIRKVTLIPGLVAGMAIAAGMAAPAAAADFYDGKTVQVVIGTRAGGNGDIQGRTILRFLEKHVAGHPRFIVKNMAGGGGILAHNFLCEAAKPDGTTIAYNIVNIVSEVLGDKGIRVSHKNIIIAGGLGSSNIVHVRKDIGGGIKKDSDFLKVTAEFKSAGNNLTSAKDLTIRLANKLLGMKFKHVTGFKSSGLIRKAIQQNEVQLTSDSLTGYLARVDKTLIKTGISIPLWQGGIPTDDGGLKSSPSIKFVPNFLQVYQMKFGKGKMPEPVAWQTYRLLVGSRAAMLRAVYLPKGAPDAAVAALRQGFVATMKDPEFLAAWKKLTRAAPGWVDGKTAQKLVRQYLESDPKVVAYLKDMVASGRR